MDKLDLAIIIPCATDVKIKYCIQSIYETCADDVEILVSLNEASEDVKEILKSFKDVKVCEIEEANLSRAYNNGIKYASRNNILLMDSDCVFNKDTIKLIYNGLKCEKLSKGLVVFRSDSLISKTISGVREYTTTDFISAFSPPLAFSKDIKDLIGGYYFNKQVPWSEDFEFDYRVRRAGIKIYYNPKAVIYHAPIRMMQDIRSGFNYGRGKWISERLKLLPQTNYFSISMHAKKFVKTYEVFCKKGLLPALYYFFIWRPINRLGYITQSLIYKLKS
jgi:glycosyltransferase involved in cell wall biosynthesis